MKRTLLGLVAGVCGLLALSNTPTAAGLVVAVMPAPAQVRVARADVVVIGTVTDVEQKPVQAAAYPGAKEKVDYFVATVKVDEHIVGAKGLTHIKVAFRAPMQPPLEPKDGARPIRPLPIRPGMQLPVLAKGQEACLFLKQHSEENFYIMPNFDDLVDKKGGEFKQMVADAKKAAKVLEDPKASLKSDKADDRFLAASMLLTRYRTPQPRVSTEPVKQEEIDAEESKLILKALAEANWKAPQRPAFGGGYSTPQQCFSSLGLTAKDGWAPKGGNYYELAQEWVKANADKYRIKRYVAESK